MASNEVMIPSGSALPAHIQALLAANPSLLAVNEAAALNIGGGSVPTIIAYMGKFYTKIDGVQEPIQVEIKDENGNVVDRMDASKISAVILKAKGPMPRAWFATAFVAGQEPASPDCSSDDGIKPRADSPNKQCESCAGCPMNMWGSAKKQDGTPAKGKACAEKKVIALYANKGVFKFAIPPASLGDWAAYAKQLAAHGLALPTVITSISFDPLEPTKLVFSYVNVLAEAALGQIIPMIDSPEVKAIIEDSPVVAQIAAPAAQAQPADDSAAKEAEAKKAAADKAAKAAEAKAKKDADAKAKKEAEEKAKAAAAASAQDDLGLGGDPAPAAAAQPADGPSDDDLAALLDL